MERKFRCIFQLPLFHKTSLETEWNQPESFVVYFLRTLIKDKQSKNATDFCFTSWNVISFRDRRRRIIPTVNNGEKAKQKQ